MDDQPIDLYQQKTLRRTYRLLIFTFIFLLFILIAQLIYFLSLFPFIESYFYLVTLSYAFAFFIITVIRYKKLNRAKFISIVLIIYALYNLGIFIYFSSLLIYISYYSNCIASFFEFMLFLSLYRAGNGFLLKLTRTDKIFKTIIILFIISILFSIFSEQNPDFELRKILALNQSISWLNFNFAPFVISLISYKALTDKGFYKGFIESIPKKTIQEISTKDEA